MLCCVVTVQHRLLLLLLWTAHLMVGIMMSSWSASAMAVCRVQGVVGMMDPPLLLLLLAQALPPLRASHTAIVFGNVVSKHRMRRNADVCENGCCASNPLRFGASPFGMDYKRKATTLQRAAILTERDSHAFSGIVITSEIIASLSWRGVGKQGDNYTAR